MLGLWGTLFLQGVPILWGTLFLQGVPILWGTLFLQGVPISKAIKYGIKFIINCQKPDENIFTPTLVRILCDYRLF